MIKVIIVVLGICIVLAVVITVIITKIIDFIKEAIRLDDLYETMDPPKYYSCIELTADQYILFHGLYPKNFLLKETGSRKNLIYISDKSYEEFEQKKKECTYSYFLNRLEPDYEYIRLKTPEEYDKVNKYFKNKEKQEEKAKQCAVQANFLKEMREKTAQEVEKASNTIKTAEDVFKIILNQTEKS